MIVLSLLLSVLLLAWANGASDNFKATATLYGSGMHPAMHLKGIQARFIDPGTGERVHMAGFRHRCSSTWELRCGPASTWITSLSTDQMGSWRGACPGPRDTSGTR